LQRLKSALWYSVGQIIDHDTLTSNTNATPQFIVALMEMAWVQIGMLPTSLSLFPTQYLIRDAENSAKDLEAFAKHAGRTQINTDDVLLLARRNDGLESLLRGFLDELRKDNMGAKSQRRAR
jgi:centromere protein S